MLKKKLAALLAIVIVLVCVLTACNFDFLQDYFKKEPAIAPIEYDDILQPDKTQKQSIIPHFISKDDVDAAPYRNIRDNKNVKIKNVSSVNELYGCLISGYKPSFLVENSNEYLIYQEILKVLDRIIKNTMSEYERVHAIYDYIIFCTQYDYDLYDQYKDDPNSVLNSNTSFHISGVFLKRLAVCDGLSKALSVMCAIEGIKTVQVTGYNGDVGHAWNKVYIHKPDYKDCQTLHDETCASDNHYDCSQMQCIETSHRAWYLIDVTSGNLYTEEGTLKKKSELLMHAFLLISDSSFLVKDYVENEVFPAYPKAEDEYNYFKNTYITDINNAKHDFYVESQQDLNALAKAIVQNELKSFEIQLANSALAGGIKSAFIGAGNQKNYNNYYINNYYIFC